MKTQNNKWISVSVALPEKREHSFLSKPLFVSDGEKVFVGQFFVGDDWSDFIYTGGTEKINVKYWKYINIPEPPK